LDAVGVSLKEDAMLAPSIFIVVVKNAAAQGGNED